MIFTLSAFFLDISQRVNCIDGIIFATKKLLTKVFRSKLHNFYNSLFSTVVEARSNCNANLQLVGNVESRILVTE